MCSQTPITPNSPRKTTFFKSGVRDEEKIFSPFVRHIMMDPGRVPT
jgi:hypothetical protein